MLLKILDIQDKVKSIRRSPTCDQAVGTAYSKDSVADRCPLELNWWLPSPSQSADSYVHRRTSSPVRTRYQNKMTEEKARSREMTSGLDPELD